MAAARFPLMDAVRRSFARTRRNAWAILCTIGVGLSGTAIPRVHAQSISSFTVQDQSDANFDTSLPKKVHWNHKIEGSHTSTTAQMHFRSTFTFLIQKTNASTSGVTSRMTATIGISDPLNCGWTLSFAGKRQGHVLFSGNVGKSHAEIHALSEIWSGGGTRTGSLVVPEWDTGLLGKPADLGASSSDGTNNPKVQTGTATLKGVGSKTITVTVAWDTYASGDPALVIGGLYREAPEVYVCHGAEWHPDNGYVMDVRLTPCTAILSGPITVFSDLPTLVPMSDHSDSCCFDVAVRDSNSATLAGLPVKVDFSGCDAVLCSDQAPDLIVDLTANTVTAFTDATGVARFCVCGTFNPPCTPVISANGTILPGNGPVTPCPTPPGPHLAYSLASNQYRVVFDTGVTPATATNVANYALSSLGNVDSAVMDGNSAVILTVSGTGLSPGQSETVNVNGVVSVPDNVVMTAPLGVTFVTGPLPVAAVRAPDPALLAADPCEDRSLYAGPAGTSGPRVTLQGIATGGADESYYLEDETGGLRSGIRIVTPPTPLVVGHRYTAVGTVENHQGMTELSGVVDVRDNGVGTLPAPIQVPLNVLLDPTCDASQSLSTRNDFEGVLVQLDSVRVNASADSGGVFEVEGPYGTFTKSIIVRNGPVNGTFVPVAGQIVRIVGVLGVGPGGFQLERRSDADVTLLVPSVGVPDAGTSAARLSVLPTPTTLALTISYSVPRTGPVTIAIYDVAGRVVRRIASGPLTAGLHTATWDGRNESGALADAGLYFCKMETGGIVLTCRVITLR